MAIKSHILDWSASVLYTLSLNIMDILLHSTLVRGRTPRERGEVLPLRMKGRRAVCMQE